MRFPFPLSFPFRPALLLALALPGLAPPAEAAGALTLDEARARVLERSPALAARQAAVRAAEGAALQARALPNPVLELEAEDFGGGLGYTDAQTTLSLEQTIETGGKRGARTAVAARARDAAALERDALRLGLLAEADRRFAVLLGAQERVALRREVLAVSADLEKTVAALAAAGEIAPLEIRRAETERITAEADLSRAEAERTLARDALASLWGEAPPDFDEAAGPLDIPPPPPAPDEVAARVDASPAVAAQQAEVARWEAELDARHRETRPDLALLGGVRRLESSGDTVFVAAVALPLPLFDRRRGAIAEAGARRDEAEAAADADRIERQAAARRARTEALLAVEQARLVQDELLPRARATYEATLEGYRRGKFRWLELLAARRDLINDRLRSIDARVLAHTATADLAERMAAGPQGPGTEEER
ncbi:MAG: TolC family protein [Acidobacteria bacterium]|jgi:cobalt-zinc-cadmium efflux system outer membrane protein|nr:TolC family protein [Acidobacteriota bacterium]